MARKQKQYHFMYKTTNLLSGRYYIGMHSTNNLEDGYLGSGIYLRRAIKKHGKENFEREILEFCKSREELKSREKQIVNLKEIANAECMNMVVGGEGGNFISNKQRKLNGIKGGDIHKYKMAHDIEYRTYVIKNVKLKNSMNMRSDKLPNIQNSYNWTNKHHTEATKQKMRKPKNIGKNNSQFGTRWITNGTVNKKIKKEEKIPNGFELGRIIKCKL